MYDRYGALRAQYLRGALIDEVVVARHFGQDTKRRPTDLTFHGDFLQSVLGVSDHNGAVLENTRYAPFGAHRVPPSTGTSANPPRYTGRERDPDTGLYYYRARYYDPDLGRFLSEDPLGFDAGDPNFYAYVGNNPLIASDPTGEFRSCPGPDCSEEDRDFLEHQAKFNAAMDRAIHQSFDIEQRRGSYLESTAMVLGIGVSLDIDFGSTRTSLIHSERHSLTQGLTAKIEVFGIPLFGVEALRKEMPTPTESLFSANKHDLARAPWVGGQRVDFLGPLDAQWSRSETLGLPLPKEYHFKTKARLGAFAGGGIEFEPRHGARVFREAYSDTRYSGERPRSSFRSYDAK